MRHVWITLIVLAAWLALPAAAAAQCDATVDTWAELKTEVEGRTTSAADGDVICVDAGTYDNEGVDIVLPNRPSAADFVTIQSTDGCAEERATASTTGLAVLTATSGELFTTATNANWWKFQCLAMTASGTTELFTLVIIGGLTETVEANAAYKIYFDRITLPDQVYGELKTPFRVSLVEDFSFTRSYCGTVLDDDLDTQCISFRNAICSPSVVDDNYFGTHSYSIIIGGDGPFVENLVCDDVTITDNTFYRDLIFQPEDIGVHKHHIELKHGATNVTIERNELWNTWAGPGHGTAPSILLSPRSGDGSCPMCQVAHVTIRNNVFYNVAQGVQVIGENEVPSEPSLQTLDVVITNNVIEYTYNCFVELYSPDTVTFSDNTCAVQSGAGASNGWASFSTPADPISDVLLMNDNIAFNGTYGILGAGPLGEGTLDLMIIDWTVTGNLIGGIEDQGNIAEGDYPTGQTFISSEVMETIFVDYGGRNYCVAPLSPYFGKGADCTQIPSLAGDAGVSNPKYRLRFRLGE